MVEVEGKGPAASLKAAGPSSPRADQVGAAAEGETRAASQESRRGVAGSVGIMRPAQPGTVSFRSFPWIPLRPTPIHRTPSGIPLSSA